MPLRLLNPQNGHHLVEVSSTNDWIKNQDIEPGHWIIADNQTNGRGRRGNSWTILGEEHIIFSGKIQMNLSSVPITLLSLFAGASLLKAIYNWMPDLKDTIKLKWPNDIYKNGKKISGFLVESEIKNDSFTVIIGFGLNIFGEEVPIEWENKIGFLLESPPLEGTKERILYSFIDYLNASLVKLMEQTGLDKEIQWIESNSTLIGKSIQFSVDGILQKGVALGYDRQGFLIVHGNNGMKHILMDTDPNFGVID
ncbi:MAG: biotin--[acetyl-CoA-carboxylase] ligase [Leptospira sp.]|nr:biotin--[acetyl-CoA-carboxylase] ligase [Leptospira sp.]